MTTYGRHRFSGEVGQLCEVDGCALNYSASLHYNDDDHPFDAGEPAGASCGWQMQNIPYGSNPNGHAFCWRLEGDPVHQHDKTGTEDTQVFDRGPGPQGGAPVMDVPAEDGVGEGPWAYVGKIGIPVGREGSAARARWNLENGQVVGAGPWPVRQWYAPDLGGAPEAWENPNELICALNVMGEAFQVSVWWSDVQSRMVRVQWGSLAYVSNGELMAAVESWPAVG